MFNKELILILQSWKCQSSVSTLGRFETPGHFLLLCFLHNRSWMSKGYRMSLMARKKVCAFCVWCIWFNSFFIQSSVTISFGTIRFASINLANLIECLLLGKTRNITVLYILFLFECAQPPSDQQFICYY